MNYKMAIKSVPFRIIIYIRSGDNINIQMVINSYRTEPKSQIVAEMLK